MFGVKLKWFLLHAKISITYSHEVRLSFVQTNKFIANVSDHTKMVLRNSNIDLSLSLTITMPHIIYKWFIDYILSIIKQM